jgi:hypothetical protein
MKVSVFTICEAATVTAGKLNLLGTFDRTMVPQTPWRHPGCAVAVQLRFEATEAGPHPWKIAFVNADGRELQQVNGVLNIQAQEGANHVVVPLVMNLQQMPLPEFGDYEMRLLLDNQEAATASLTVCQAPAQPMAV